MRRVSRAAVSRGLLVLALVAVAAQASGQPGSRLRNRQGPAPAAPGSPASTSVSAAGQSRIVEASQLGAPTGVTSTTDVQVCSQHGGFGFGLACKALLPQGRLVLVWRYATTLAPVTGFHVWRVDGGAHALVADQSGGADATGVVLDAPPPGGYAGACYALSAYGGGAEGALSAPFCAGAGGVVQTLVLRPLQNRSIGRFHTVMTGVNPEDKFDNEVEANQVGYIYETQKDAITGDRSVAAASRLGLLFDAAPLAGRTIVSARLKLSVQDAWIDAPFTGPENVTDHHTSCAGKIAVGIDRWWTNTDWIDDAVVVSPGRYQGPDVAMDVTPIVRQWASGQPNFGLVLQGEEENFAAFTEASCLTSYTPGSYELDVEYE